MWTVISKLLINIVIAIVSDKVVVDGAKRMIVKAVDSKVDKVGITNEDAKEIIHSITESGLNSLSKAVVSKVL